MSLLGLKQIPCPAGSGCTAFKCLFRHDDDAPVSTGIADVGISPSTNKRAGSPSLGEAEEPQNKRSKVGTLGSSLAQSTGAPSSTDAPTAARPAAFQPTKVVPAPQAPMTMATSAASLFESALSTRPRPASVSVSELKLSAPRLGSGATAAATTISTGAVRSRTQSSTAALKAPDHSPRFSASVSSPSISVSSSNKKLLPSQKQKRATDIPTGASSTSSLLSKQTPGRPPAPPPPKKGVILTPVKVPVDPIGFSGRLKVIQMIHAEFVRLDHLLRTAHPDRTDLFLSQEEADKMALNVEATVAAGPTAVYRNIAGARLSGYKKMNVDAWVKERDAAKNPPKAKSNVGDSGPRIIDTGLTPEQESFVAGLLLTPIKNLAKHGYIPVAPSETQIAQAKKAVAMSKGWEKCHRCEKRFQVFPERRAEDGALTSGGSCTHHPGRMYYPESSSNVGGKSRGNSERKFRCCHQAIGDSAGCTTSEHHVFKISDPPRLGQVLQFATTPENSMPATSATVVCFDCEMGYTVYGLELLRLTATAWPSGDNILDVLVRPQGSVLDFNSKYSGVYPEHFANAKMWTGFEDPIPAPAPGEKIVARSGELKMVSSPAAARDLLFSLLTPETILIGHGLENDLNITRIIHPKLIDTVLLFPHRAGLPARNGLKALASSHLNRQIQVDDGSGKGHDSAEDARTAGELVRLKVQEKWRSMQVKGWKLVDGKFVAPA